MRRILPIFVLVAALLQADCAGVTGGSGNSGNPGTPPPAVTVSVSPNAANVRASASQSFTASVIVTPSRSKTYTLYATNAFGRTTASVNITVQ